MATTYCGAITDDVFHTFHTFVVQLDGRDRFVYLLAAKGIQTAIHYPIPIHLQPAAKHLGYKNGDFEVTETQAKRIVSLPVHQFLSKGDLTFIVDNVNSFFHQ